MNYAAAAMIGADWTWWAVKGFGGLVYRGASQLHRYVADNVEEDNENDNVEKVSEAEREWRAWANMTIRIADEIRERHLLDDTTSVPTSIIQPHPARPHASQMTRPVHQAERPQITMLLAEPPDPPPPPQNPDYDPYFNPFCPPPRATAPPLYPRVK